MPITLRPPTFRRAFPAFEDQARFPSGMIQYWLTIAEHSINLQRFGGLADHGAALFVAHNISLERKAMDEGENGMAPGMSEGPVSSKSVDKVSVGFDTAGGQELEAGHWNLTIYGTRFIRLLRQMGAGGIQIGTPGCAPVGSGPAWPGPWPWNFPNMN